MHEESRVVIQQLVDISGGAGSVDHVWYLDAHEPGSVLTAAPAVQDEANRLYYVDLYCPGKLMVYVPATGSYSAPNVHRYLALDSNMFNSFQRYVLRGERNTTHVAGMEQLIDYAIVERYSVLPTPYLLEIIADRGFEAARPYCEEIVEAVLRLQYMDGEVYRSRREFSYTNEALGKLEERFGDRDFHAAAQKRTEQLLGGKVLIRAHYYTSYLVVLALIAIGLEHADRDERIDAFDELLTKRMGGSYPRYMLLARLYFYEKISRWIKSVPGSTNYSAQGIRAAAYDVALTMVNEEWMQLSNPGDPDVIMLVTHDQELARNAPIIKLKGMSVLKNGSLQVVNPWDEALVNEIFGKNADQVRSEMDAKLKGAPTLEVPPQELMKIIEEYERRLNVQQSALSSLKF